MATGEVLRGGMVGAGAWSPIQLKAWSAVPDAHIVALCDRHPERRDPMAERFAVPAIYESVEEMIEAENLDFVDICVRPYSHASLVRTVADSQLPILCQKPFCRSLDEARESVDYCERTGVRLMINENYRWQSSYRHAKEILETGRLGQPFMAQVYMRTDFARPPFTSDQAYLAEMDRLILYEVGVHYLDSLRFLFGNPTSAYARTHTVSPAMSGEDVMILVLSYPEMTAIVQVSWSTIPSEILNHAPALTIEGTTGTLCVTADDRLVVDSEEGHHEESLRPRSERAFAADTQQHFVDCLRSGKPFESDGRDNLATMALMYACYQSAATGQTIAMSSKGS